MKIWNGYQKGVNLGGWFSQCDHSKDRYDNFIKEDDFAVIKSWGADHVRLPIDYELLEKEGGSPDESGYDRLKKVIRLCRKNGLNLIFDLHKTAGFSFDKGEGESGFFESEKYQERFYRLWENIALHFAGDADIVAFELLNEVTEKEYKDVWNRISGTCIRRIRAIAPSVYILVGGYYHNSVTAVKDLALPFDDKIIYNFHCYEPHIFTHQGAYWIDGMDLSFRLPVTSTFGQMREADRSLDCCLFSDEIYGDLPSSDTLSPAFFESLMAEAVRVAEERNVPLYCGEYGVIDRATPEDTVVWYRMIHEALTHYGIGRAAWSYREMDFGLADKRLDAVREELIRYL